MVFSNDSLLPFSPAAAEREDFLIAELDPLAADDLILRVPAFNQARDSVELVLLTVDLLPSLPQLAAFSRLEAAAAMRDIGLLLGSLKRHGVEPVRVIPQLEEKLNHLGNLMDLPPRDTLLHYTVWNPTGVRERTYTGTDTERHLIASVRVAMQPLLQSISHLLALHTLPLFSPEFALQCEAASEAFDKVVDGLVLAYRKVSPQYFAQELRFYFDPIELNNQQYLGPGAVEMPMFLFDHLLWSSDCDNAEYRTFKETYLPYILPPLRGIYHHFADQPSMITQACEFLDVQNKPDSAVLAAARGLNKLGTLLKSFRMPHQKLANAAYSHSGEEQRTHGSGGYETSILTHIINLNMSQLQKLEDSLKYYKLRTRTIV